MKHANTVLHHLLRLIPRHRFDQAVERHDGDRRVRRFSCWNQLTVLLFGQLSGCQTLRGLVDTFGSLGHLHYHLGVQTLRRSTLADANAKRSPAIYQELFFFLLGQVRTGLGKAEQEMVRLIDSTTIDLNLNQYRWARFRTTKAGIKLHTVYDPDAQVPTFFALTEAKVHDRRAATQLPLLDGATYVFDRAYNDYGWYYQLAQRDIRFVGRMKTNAQYEVLAYLAPEAEAVLEDQHIRLSSPKARQACPMVLRRIRYRRAEDNKVLVFLSNDLDASAEEIAALYKQRWQIELFFKWIKQNLKIKRFVGTSENAVRTQVLVALIAYLLLRLAQLQTHSPKSLLEWARWVAINLTRRCSLSEIHAPPPEPQSRAERRDSPQLALLTA